MARPREPVRPVTGRRGRQCVTREVDGVTIKGQFTGKPTPEDLAWLDELARTVTAVGNAAAASGQTITEYLEARRSES
jgi:hypothetical protein